jgi:peroxiredoxin
MQAKDKMTQNVYSSLFHPAENKLAVPYLAVSCFENLGRPAFMKKIYYEMDERQKESYYGKILKQLIPVTVGETFPLFSLPTLEGKKISLQDILSKARLTVVHIWATDSYRRQEYQSELKVLYNKYHDKGFNIIGVSADDSASLYTYKKMLKESPVPWLNVSDLKGNQKGSIVDDLFREGGHETKNTTNFLLDATGKIVAYDKTGSELQWYLWKEFGE